MSAVQRSFSRCMRTALLISAMQAAAGLSLHAQDTVTVSPGGVPRRCTYEACALLIEHGVFGDRIREGIYGPRYEFGFSGATLVRLVARVPTARIEAERGRRQRIRGALATMVGGIVLGSVLASTASPDATISARHRMTALGSTAAGIYGCVQLSRSGQSFSRAIVLYNREVLR